MKIAMIGSRGIPAIYGGIETHLEELASRLVTIGDEVIVYCRNYYTPKNMSSYKGVTLRRLPAVKSKHLDNIIHTFFATVDVLFRRVDVVHFHAIGPSILCFIPVMFGIKTVVTIHGLDWNRKKWGAFATWCLRLAERIAVRCSDQLIVVSRTLKEYIKDKYQRDAKNIPNGIKEPTLREPRLIKQYGLAKQNYILSVGRLVPEKGIHYLIDAFKQVDIDMKLVIVGDSCFSDEYVNQLKQKVDDRVMFLGYLNGKTLEELYSNAYLFVLPSEEEGLPISLLEAVSYQIPVLVSDIAPNLEVAGDFGFIFKNKDSLDLSRKLTRLLLHKQIDTCNTFEAAESIRSYYNWDSIALDTQRTYEKLHGLTEETNLFEYRSPFFMEYLKCKIAHIIGSLLYYSRITKLCVYLRKRFSKKGKLLVLFYHRVAEPMNGDLHLCVSPDNFKEHLSYLTKNYNVISQGELLQFLKNKTYPKKDSVFITFDDGYEDNFTNAFPLLKKYNIPATVFVATDYIGKNDMLKADQIKEMSEYGITFGAHTQSHARLGILDTDRIKKEILNSKDTLERILKKPVSSFAYPRGYNDDFDNRTIRVLEQSRFLCAFTANKHNHAMRSSMFELPRKGIANFSLPAFISKVEGFFDMHCPIKRIFKGSVKK